MPFQQGKSAQIVYSPQAPDQRRTCISRQALANFQDQLAAASQHVGYLGPAASERQEVGGWLLRGLDTASIRGTSWFGVVGSVISCLFLLSVFVRSAL